VGYTSNVAGKTAGRKRARGKQRPRWVKVLKISLTSLTLLVLVGGVSFGFYFATELRRAQEMIPSLPSIMAQVALRPTTILSADGKVLFSVSTEYRQPVRIADVPKVVVDATLAAEDKRFYDHGGVDYWAMGRTLFVYAKEGKASQGGSTLTMQLAKRVYTSPEQTFQRKVRDMALAVTMEHRLTKDQILELYLNQVYYGSGAFGIKAAADVYFGKKLEDLTVAEAATLARLVRRPSEENPFKSPDRAKRNRDIVLRLMREENMISDKQYQEALETKLDVKKKSFASGAKYNSAHHFVDWILDTVKRQLPDEDITTGGYVIQTTLDSNVQAIAEKAVQDVVKKYRRQGLTTGAFVLMDKEGRVIAMVGGADYWKRQYNVVTQGRRQPGSSFKPFIYAAALSSGTIGPHDHISNARFSMFDVSTRKEWVPKNSGRVGFGGSYSVRNAIAQSINVPAVRVLNDLGPTTAVAYCRDVFGFRSPLDPYLPLALGASAVSPLEMAQAYSVFQNAGSRATPFGIVQVLNPERRVLLRNQPQIKRGVLSGTVARNMDEYLRAVVTSGTGRSALSIPGARGKTGTTDANRDAWFCGYTDDFVGIGWVANEQHDPSRNPPWVYNKMGSNVFGGTVTIQIWTEVLKAAPKHVKVKGGSNTFTDADTLWAEAEEARRGEVIVAPARPRTRVAADDPPPAPVEDESIPIETIPVSQPAEAPPRPVTNPTPPPTDPATPPTATVTRTPPRTVPPTDRRPPATPPRDDTVSVEICADSLQRAKIYCPETVTRRFKKGSEPSRRCHLHG
jgi:penicillin-binding protein 1A